MNEHRRAGKGDEYIEIMADWGNIDYHQFAWWFQELIAGDKHSNKELCKALSEVIESFPEDEDETK